MIRVTLGLVLARLLLSSAPLTLCRASPSSVAPRSPPETFAVGKYGAGDVPGLLDDWFFWEGPARTKSGKPHIRCGGSAVPAAADLKTVGHISHAGFFDDYKDVEKSEAKRYRLIKPLGQGKQGVVMLAEDLNTHTLVAIKKAKASSLAREVALTQLLQGSDDVMRIQHVLLPSSDKHFENGFVAFESLARRVDRVEKMFRGQGMPRLQLLRMMYRMDRALHNLHMNGVYHLDVKVDNIMVDHSCTPKFIDFGIAQVLDKSGDKRGMLGTNIIHGCHAPETHYRTRVYMKSKSMEHDRVEAAEVWNLGCTFFHMAFGGDPWHHFRKYSGVRYDSQLAVYRDVLGKPSTKVLTKYYSNGAIEVLRRGAHSKRAPEGDVKGFARYFPSIDKDVLEFILKMMSYDPEARPSTLEILHSPLFQEVLDATVEQGDYEQDLQVDKDLHALIKERLRRKGLVMFRVDRQALYYEIAAAFAAHDAVSQEPGELK